jgi:hypothetical protein
VYSATSNDESDAKDNRDENIFQRVTKDLWMITQERINIPEVKTEDIRSVSFDEAAKLAEWRKSMKTEVKDLQNRGCWRDWTGKVVKRKTRLVVLGCLKREGVDYDEIFAPVAKCVSVYRFG